MLALALSRELTPVVTSIIVAGRVGSAFAAELGTMQVARHGSFACMHVCEALAGHLVGSGAGHVTQRGEQGRVDGTRAPWIAKDIDKYAGATTYPLPAAAGACPAAQVSEQTDSLRVLGSDPVDYLITPRVMACMVAGPILNLLCFCMGEPGQGGCADDTIVSVCSGGRMGERVRDPGRE